MYSVDSIINALSEKMSESTRLVLLAENQDHFVSLDTAKVTYQGRPTQVQIDDYVHAKFCITDHQMAVLTQQEIIGKFSHVLRGFLSDFQRKTKGKTVVVGAPQCQDTPMERMAHSGNIRIKVTSWYEQKHRLTNYDLILLFGTI